MSVEGKLEWKDGPKGKKTFRIKENVETHSPPSEGGK